ncbi:hypothetical protein C8F04DRAFT_1258590 [Mycena alexandri]|uniref:Uncharacterized protein n=1 Tax=Mycena alexandri TaxID=1745969 RepID=A0AAD6X875_9AGAR|nr:hypothetical protein C8F04DRAFT_1258590 [Mycena alexandri]
MTVRNLFRNSCPSVAPTFSIVPDLIPFQRYLDIYDPSPLTAVYMYAYFDTEFQDLEQYWSFVLDKRLNPTDLYHLDTMLNWPPLC